MCPKGDDPLTTKQYDHVITVTTSNSDASEALSGNFYLRFAGQLSSAIDSDGSVATASSCSTAVAAMENIAAARCFQGSVDGTTKATT